MKMQRYFALTALWAFGAIAHDVAPAQMPVEAQAAASADYQEVKYQTLQLEVKANAARPLEPNVVTFYVGSSAPSLRLLHASASLDAQIVANQDVDDRAFHALGGPNRLLRVGRQPLADGHHSLHAEFLPADRNSRRWSSMSLSMPAKVSRRSRSTWSRPGL